MSKYSFSGGMFGENKTVVILNTQNGSEFEATLRGATALKYIVPFNGELINILDGFADPEELKSTKGARNWIMVPFANRIYMGNYSFNGQEYTLDPIPPRNQVMHGLLSNVQYELFSVEKTENSIAVVFVNKDIRKDKNKGYPFSFDVYVKYKIEDDKLTVSVTGENVGEEPAPFFSGWHGYFQTGNESIDELVLTLDADDIIAVNKDLIPEDGNKAYGDIKSRPDLDFSSSIPESRRTLKGKILDNGYAGLKKYSDGYSRAKLYDPRSGLILSVFQRGGITLVYTGDNLPSRIRKAVAIEPMQFMTNSFNRIEESEGIIVKPGRSTEFEFGVEVIK